MKLLATLKYKKKTLKKNKVADYSEKKVKTKKNNRIIKYSNKKKKIKNINRDIFKISFFNQEIIKYN